MYYIDTSVAYSCNTYNPNTQTAFICNATVISPIYNFQLFFDFGDGRQVSYPYAGNYTGGYTVQTQLIQRTYVRNGTYTLFIRLIPSQNNDTVNVYNSSRVVTVTGRKPT